MGVIKTWEGALNFLFFESCLVCGAPHRAVCATCLGRQRSARLKCFGCGWKNPQGRYCSNCRRPNLPERVLARFAFAGAIRELVHEFKYADAWRLAKPLAREMAGLVREATGGDDSFVLAPIPLSRRRLAFRGYNQAALLAREISDLTGIAVWEGLVRSRVTESQVDAGSRKERRGNIKGAFAVEEPTALPEKVILVDDVITSAATIEEAAKTLKRYRSRVKRVVAIALAMGK